MKSQIAHKLSTATLLLWLFASGCADPAYRLDGNVVTQAGGVAILPNSAEGMLDSLRDTHRKALVSLQQTTAARRDSLSADGKDIESNLARARGRVRSAQKSYYSAFEGIRRFRSFGGNAIFATEDRNIKTKKLLEEIADRFYKGKAFSLETETELRRFIRSRLASVEKKMTRAKSSLTKVKRSRGGNVGELEQLEEDLAKAQRELMEAVNDRILAGLEKMVLRRAKVDSTGSFTFDRLPPGRYYLYAPYPLPSGWLVPIHLEGHRKQGLGGGNTRDLLVRDTS